MLASTTSAVTLAPTDFASDKPWTTPLCANSEPPVGIKICMSLYLRGLSAELNIKSIPWELIDLREPRTIPSFGDLCWLSKQVRRSCQREPRSGAVLILGRRLRASVDDATQIPPVSALKRTQLPSARAEPAGGCCNRGSSFRS